MTRNLEWLGSEEELHKLMDQANGKLVDKNDWHVMTKDKEKFYDANEFLKDADYYYNLIPQNLIQTSAKLWLASVYTVKKFYLQIKIHAVSHRSLKFLMKLAVRKCPNAEMASDLTESWIYAEQFHQYTCGSKNFKPKEFGSRKIAVEYFVREFPSIEKSAVLKEALKLVDCSDENIKLKSDPGETSLGKEKYSFDYKFPAYLHCTIGTGAESSDFLVAWTRMRDDALLTAGGHAFTSDTRFQISLKRRTRDWVLLIRRVQASDAGCYLCEINTEPESTLVPVYLNVIPVQEIPKRLYATGVHVANTNLVARMEGDAILLNCTINAKNGGITKHFGDILWTKDILPIEIDDEYKYTSFASISPSGDVVHVLRIAHVTPADGGLYSCEGENIARATQMVHVNSAALATAMAARKSSKKIHNHSATSRMLPHFNLLFILFILYYL